MQYYYMIIVLASQSNMVNDDNFNGSFLDMDVNQDEKGF